MRALDGAGLARRSIVAVDPARLDEALVELATVLDEGVDVDVDVVPGDVEQLLDSPGLVLADEGDPVLALADARGLPAVEHRVASPYARERDPDRFEIVTPASWRNAA